MRKNNKIILLSVLCLLFVCVFSAEAMAAGIFDSLKEKTTDFARSLRVLAYAISCFGIVMFTFLAITGKINFRHLGYIFISLFMLSATGALIDYFSGGHASLKSKLGDTYTKAVCRSSICR